MSRLDGFEMESNVGRDVLSTANAFGSVPKVVAEYVTNCIDAREPGQAVNVSVSRRRAYGQTRVVITDDARGMDDADLRRFFFMHAENEARRRGRTTRGRFGTGKAAAFGIGNSLQVETRRNGRRWVVRLQKSELQEAVRQNRKPRPEVLQDGVATDEPNGTTIIIDGVTKSFEEQRVVNELRRRLGRHIEAHNIVVASKPATMQEPSASRTWTFRSGGQPVSAAIGADVTCVIKAAVEGHVDEGIRGIVVTANDFPVAQITATGDYANRLFGHCDVPALDKDESTPGPYTDNRDLTLNEDNATAGPLAQWLRECLGQAVGELAADEREQRRRARDAALRNAASRMEAVLNRHYQGEFRLSRTEQGDVGIRPKAVSPSPDGGLVQPSGDGFAGYDIPEGQGSGGGQGPGTEEQPPPPSPEAGQPRERDPFGEGRGEPVTNADKPKPRRTRGGGFKIEFAALDESAPRCSYLESELTILVNLNHPELAAAHRDGDTPLFRMLAFEAAAQEYSFATAYQRLDDDVSLDASDILQYVRQTMESLTRDVSDVVGDLVDGPSLAMAATA